MLPLWLVLGALLVYLILYLALIRRNRIDRKNLYLIQYGDPLTDSWKFAAPTNDGSGSIMYFDRVTALSVAATVSSEHKYSIVRILECRIVLRYKNEEIIKQLEQLT